METKVCKDCGRELPIDDFRYDTRWGRYTGVCKECAAKKGRETRSARKTARLETAQKNVEECRHLRLSEFSPRELMVELARRGYEGKLLFTETKTVDISKL